MSNNIRPSEINNGTICEALGCYAKATNKVAVKVGHTGTILLFLCDSCKLKICAHHIDINHSKLEIQGHDKLR